MTSIPPPPLAPGYEERKAAHEARVRPAEVPPMPSPHNLFAPSPRRPGRPPKLQAPIPPAPVPPPPVPAVEPGKEVSLNAQHSLALQSMRTLMRRGGINLAEFQARLYESDMVDLLAQFAKDVTLDVEFRRLCINDILDRARGRPMGVARVEAPDLITVATDDALFREVEEGRRAAEEMREMQNWHNVPLAQWPAHIRARYEREASLLAKVTDLMAQETV